MPTPQTATTATIMSRISRVPIKVPLVHAITGAGVMIKLPVQHTQGNRSMKDAAATPIRPEKAGSTARRWPRIAGLALLLPFALASTAQNAPPAPQPTLPTVVTQPAPKPPVAPNQIAYVAPPQDAKPVAPAFDVARFEATAQAMVADGRVPAVAASAERPPPAPVRRPAAGRHAGRACVRRRPLRGGGPGHGRRRPRARPRARDRQGRQGPDRARLRHRGRGYRRAGQRAHRVP